MFPDVAVRLVAILESVLGATPHEFESRILRHSEQARREGRPRQGSTLFAHQDCSAQFSARLPLRADFFDRFPPFALAVPFFGFDHRTSPTR